MLSSSFQVASTLCAKAIAETACAVDFELARLVDKENAAEGEGEGDGGDCQDSHYPCEPETDEGTD
jgi:hypothetical protein